MNLITLLKILVISVLGQTTVVAPNVISPTNLVTEVTFIIAGENSTEQLNITVVPTNPPLLQWMRDLPPLQKIHYSWTLPEKFLDNPNDPILYEYVRLSNACCITAQWPQPHHIDSCVQVCKKVNATNPIIPASIGINISPYHRFVPANDPPTNFEGTHIQEINHIQNTFANMKLRLDQANQDHNTNINVTAAIVDSERYRFKPESDTDSTEWNAAIHTKYQLVHDIIQTNFPGVREEWYSRGMWTPSLSTTGWTLINHHDAALTTPGDTSSFALYYVPEEEKIRQILRKTHEHAISNGEDETTPWVALGAGYAWGTEVAERKFTLNWPFQLAYSRFLGAQINVKWYGDRPERFGPWNAVKVAIFYPEPFGRTHDWGRHFVAYVRGAHGITELP